MSIFFTGCEIQFHGTLELLQLSVPVRLNTADRLRAGEWKDGKHRGSEQLSNGLAWDISTSGYAAEQMSLFHPILLQSSVPCNQDTNK